MVIKGIRGRDTGSLVEAEAVRATRRQGAVHVRRADLRVALVEARPLAAVEHDALHVGVGPAAVLVTHARLAETAAAHTRAEAWDAAAIMALGSDRALTVVGAVGGAPQAASDVDALHRPVLSAVRVRRARGAIRAGGAAMVEQADSSRRNTWRRPGRNRPLGCTPLPYIHRPETRSPRVVGRRPRSVSGEPRSSSQVRTPRPPNRSEAGGMRRRRARKRLLDEARHPIRHPLQLLRPFRHR